MSTDLQTRSHTRRLPRWLAPIGALTLVAATALAMLPSAYAYSGDSPNDAIPAQPYGPPGQQSGQFSGTNGPSASTWFTFRYTGNNVNAVIAVLPEPHTAN